MIMAAAARLIVSQAGTEEKLPNSEIIARTEAKTRILMEGSAD
jgi:hypothetical protein